MKTVKYLLIIWILLINIGCIDAEKSMLFAGNGNNSDYNFADLQAPSEKWELKSFSYGGATNYGLYVKGKDGVNDDLKDRIVIFFHGNGGRIDKSTQIDMANFFYKNGINFFAMEYRGYGQSKNFKTTETSTYEDAEYGYNYILQMENGKYTEDKIIIMGHSLGSAVAIDLAVKKNEKALIVMSAFKNFSNELTEFTGFEIPGNWISDAKYDNVSKIDRINSDLLLIHGEKDQMVKVDNSKELYNKAKELKKLCIISNANHDDIVQKMDNVSQEQILNYIKK